MTNPDRLKILAAILIVTALAVCVEAHATCTEDNFDSFKVAKALQQGLSKDALLMHMEGSRSELNPIRMEKIRGLIDEAFTLQPDQAEGWWKKHYKECPKEDEA